MYEQAEPVRSSLSGPGSGRTGQQEPTVHLSTSTGRVRYGKAASDKQEDGVETSSDAYEEAEAVKRHATYTSADRAYHSEASGWRRARSFIHSHRSCLAAASAVVLSLIAVGLALACFINEEDTSHLSDTFNDRNQTAAMGCLGGKNKMPEPVQNLEEVIQQLQSVVATMTAKGQKVQEEIQELKTKMTAKDQKIQALEQRPYIERCESGWLGIPWAGLFYGSGERNLYLNATFTTPFRKTPVVTLGFVLLDDAVVKQLRVSAAVSSKSMTRLTVRIRTWADSQPYSAAVHWMACA
ncbi:PREDICTED: uncharacterized protein LOC109472386 [Branchiostoma belcheri]|uniref:Uncharacterized protein LOC109472386 n=1 Tax=Branchiostoma belcheri TaxID=7741 RepID=A0A6P4Z194_BRABE|nr:PREDICTED: uncharacterized protein LOC109472386 [Branchiostoma belcheri]